MIRMLKSTKDSAVKARTQAVNQMKALVVTAPAELLETLDALTAIGLAVRCKVSMADISRSTSHKIPLRRRESDLTPIVDLAGSTYDYPNSYRLGRRRRSRLHCRLDHPPARGLLLGRGPLVRGGHHHRRRARAGTTLALACPYATLGVDSGRGQNRTLRPLSTLWPPVFAGEQDVSPPKGPNVGQKLGLDSQAACFRCLTAPPRWTAFQ